MRALCACLGLILLAGCVSPVERCERAATRELRELDKMIGETEINLERGYRLRPVVEPPAFDMFCGPGGPHRPRVCRESDGIVTYRREPINVPAEQAKLKSLLGQRPAVVAQANRALRNCPAS